MRRNTRAVGRMGEDGTMTDTELLTLAAQYDRGTTPEWIVQELETRGYQYANGEWD